MGFLLSAVVDEVVDMVAIGLCKDLIFFFPKGRAEKLSLNKCVSANRELFTTANCLYESCTLRTRQGLCPFSCRLPWPGIFKRFPLG